MVTFPFILNSKVQETQLQPGIQCTKHLQYCKEAPCIHYDSFTCIYNLINTRNSYLLMQFCYTCYRNLSN